MQNPLQVQLLDQTELEALSRIYQDMSYVFGVLVEYKALKDSGCENQKLLNLYRNRCIVQLNLSNSINVDDYQTLSQQRKSDRYFEFKKNAQSAFSILQQHFQYLFSQDNDLQNMFQQYQQYSLTEQPIINQQQQSNPDSNFNFNHDVVNKMIQALNQSDQQRIQLLQKYQKDPKIVKDLINPKKIVDETNQRYNQAKQKIQQIQIYSPESMKRIEGYDQNIKGTSLNQPTVEQDIKIIIQELSKDYQEVLVLFGAIDEVNSSQQISYSHLRQQSFKNFNYLINLCKYLGFGEDNNRLSVIIFQINQSIKNSQLKNYIQFVFENIIRNKNQSSENNFLNNQLRYQNEFQEFKKYYSHFFSQLKENSLKIIKIFRNSLQTRFTSMNTLEKDIRTSLFLANFTKNQYLLQQFVQLDLNQFQSTCTAQNQQQLQNDLGLIENQLEQQQY